MESIRGSNWLIIGGAGYIGAHVVRGLVDQGARTTVVDDLSTGLAPRLPSSTKLIVADAVDPGVLLQTTEFGPYDGVIHLAALKQARESVRVPSHYWSTNLKLVLSLIEFLRNGGSSRVLYSSSCSIFGSANFVDERTPVNPISPYGWTKLVGEQILHDLSPELGVSLLSLRYFNVIGNGTFPFAHDHATESLIPSIFRRIVDGKRPQVFGFDFPTPDGTCLRDYLDVRDLASAHVLGAANLLTDEPVNSSFLNLSSGTPTSVLEIVNLALSLTESSLEPEFMVGRQGDPASVWGSNETAKEALGWSPVISLRESVESHWKSVSTIPNTDHASKI